MSCSIKPCRNNGSIWIDGYHGHDTLCLEENYRLIENVAALHAAGFNLSEHHVPIIKANIQTFKNFMDVSASTNEYQISSDLRCENLLDLTKEDGIGGFTFGVDKFFPDYYPKLICGGTIKVVAQPSDHTFCKGYYKIAVEFLDVENDRKLEVLNLIYEYNLGEENNQIIEFKADKECLIVNDNIIKVKILPKLKASYDEENGMFGIKDTLCLLAPLTIVCEENLLAEFLKCQKCEV